MDEVKDLAGALNVLVSAVNVGQSKGAYSLPEAALIVRAVDWLRANLAQSDASAQVPTPPIGATGSLS